MSFDYSTPAIEKWQIDKFSDIVDEFEDAFSDCVNQKTDTVTDYQMILLHIAGKILVTTREILILCAHGYPDGALSLGRNLYEQMMIVLFFEMHKHDADFQNYTNDYLLSYQIQRNKSLRDIEKYIPDGSTAVLNNEYEKLKKQASQKVKGDYWWTGFSTFSALADSIIQNETNQTLRSFLGRHYATYKRACISLHAEQTSSIISKVWGLCNPLRDDGVSYGDYLEQLTYLIFLKMSDEYSKPPYKKETGIPAGYTWQDMNALKGAELEEQYKATLEELGKQSGLLGQIFKQATNKISNAAILYRVVQMIDKEKWVSMSSDVKGEIYEGLLQKNAEDIKSGAGQYFTPRPLIKAMVKCLRPEPGKTIAEIILPNWIQGLGKIKRYALAV